MIVPESQGIVSSLLISSTYYMQYIDMFYIFKWGGVTQRS